jgi:hypothetical protein
MAEPIFDDGFCIDGTTSVHTCIPNALMDAWHENEAENESDFTLGDLFRSALIDLLRDLGKLPKPYV